MSFHSPPILSLLNLLPAVSTDSSYFKVAAGAVPALGEGGKLHSCEDSKCLPELGWSLTCAGPEGKEEEMS